MDKKINLVLVGGIRTHYVKLYVFQQMLEKIDSDLVSQFNFIYVDAGQHYDNVLRDNFINDLNIKFDYRILHESTCREELWGNMLKQLCYLYDEIDKYNGIDYVMVFGDVITTIIASVAAMLKNYKIVHVESGVRVDRGLNIEENCRRATDHLAKIRFTSSINDLHNLHSEGLSKNSFFSGDIIYDYLKDISFSNSKKRIEYEYNKKKYDFILDQEYVLISLHHMENQNTALIKNIFYAFGSMNTKVLFIVHPSVKKIIISNDINAENIISVDYINYENNLYLIKNAKYVLTDSGGIQREAYYLNKRCIVRSYQTVWEEIVKLGNNLVVGSTLEEIYKGIDWAVSNENNKCVYINSFGNGDAVYNILKIINEVNDEIIGDCTNRGRGCV